MVTETERNRNQNREPERQREKKYINKYVDLLLCISKKNIIIVISCSNYFKLPIHKCVSIDIIFLCAAAAAGDINKYTQILGWKGRRIFQIVGFLCSFFARYQFKFEIIYLLCRV